MDIITTPTTASDLIVIDPLPIDQNPAAVYLAGLGSARSKATQRQALEVVTRLIIGSPDVLACNWAGLRFQHTAAVRAELAGRYAPQTANRILCALRGVLKAAFKLGQISGDDYLRAGMVDSVIGETIPAGRELQSGELAALMAACENDTTPAGARDAAVIALAYSCGLRRAEVVTLDLADYDQETGRLVIRGKRSKERTAYLVNGAAHAMADWLAIRGSEPGALFWPVNKGGNLTPRRMTNQAVYNLLSKRAGEAGVNKFSPHDLRRTFVSDLLDAGADISTVAKMAGHASVTTTQRYDRRPEAAKVKAAGLLHIPYRGRLIG